MKFKYTVLFLLVISSAYSQPTTPECGQLRDIFRELNVTHYEQIPSKPISGEMLKICPSEKTCCTDDIESDLLVPVENGLKDMIKSSISYLKTILDKDVYTFRDQVVNLISESRTQTITVLAQVHRVEQVTLDLVKELYDQLERSLYGSEIEVRPQVMKFFKSLYPQVFIQDIAGLKSVTSEARECIASTFVNVKPFTDIPESVAEHLEQAFLTARSMVHGLQAAYDAVRSTESFKPKENCSPALVRLTHCSSCAAQFAARPCAGFCSNVMRGCLANLAELDKPWEGLITAIQHISAAMVGRHNVQLILSTMSNKISAAVMLSIDQSTKLNSKVSSICGLPHRAKRSSDDSPRISSSGRLMGRLPDFATNNTLFENLQTLAYQLLETKDFYGNLGDNLCKEFSVNHGATCWNGRTLGEYNVPLVALGVEAQTNNTETGPVDYDPLMEMIGSRMLAITGTLMQRMEPQSLLSYSKMEGSGSGHYHEDDDGSLGDDEDFNASGEEAGSGREYDENVPHSNPEDNEIVPSTGAAGIAKSVLSQNIWVFAFVTAVFISMPSLQSVLLLQS